MQMQKYICKSDRVKSTCNALFRKDLKYFHESLVNTYFIHPVISRSCSNDAGEIHEIPRDIKCKGKISVVKKSVSPNRRTTSIIEWKSASSVIKKLNWENRNLFGPLLVSKREVSNRRKIQKKDEIQYRTQIPIIEPTVLPNSLSETLSSLKSSQIIEAILKFPLMNKADPKKLTNERIQEFNILRKHLELLYRNSLSPNDSVIVQESWKENAHTEISGGGFGMYRNYNNLLYPSVRLILQKTMPGERLKILESWKEDMIKKLGEEGFQMYRKELVTKEVSLHYNINCLLCNFHESEIEIKEENVGYWKSLQHVFPRIKDLRICENNVAHPFLCYKGMVHILAIYKGELIVINWKTSKKPKLSIQNTYDCPLQIAAYIGALNFDPEFEFLVSKGLIVIAYENGAPATMHFIDTNSVQQYWNEYLQRVKQFCEMKISETESL